MKKVGTGERVNISDLRRSVGRAHADADSDLASEQMLVSELMNTTPSSSYENDISKGAGYFNNGPDASTYGSPQTRFDSDVEAANEVVSQMAVEGDLIVDDLIVEVDVPEIEAESEQGSLLSKGLAAVKISQTSEEEQGRDEGIKAASLIGEAPGDGENIMEDPRSQHGPEGSHGGCTALQLVTSLISECKLLSLGSHLEQEPENYDLRIADDGWDPDLDFPELDSSATITDVGVDQFVLCSKGKVEPILHIHVSLHQGLEGPLTGTGAMEAPGAGASMTLEVDFQTPEREATHHISFPLTADHAPDPMRYHERRPPGGDSSAPSVEVEESQLDGAVKLRNIDTGEEIALEEIEKRVPPAMDPSELFSSEFLKSTGT